jgi:hypothetical protein
VKVWLGSIAGPFPASESFPGSSLNTTSALGGEIRNPEDEIPNQLEARNPNAQNVWDSLHPNAQNVSGFLHSSFESVLDFVLRTRRASGHRNARFSTSI